MIEIPVAPQPATAVGVAAGAPQNERDLYPPMADVIRKRWAQDYRLDSLLVEVTAAQGGKQTGGKWTRPDITAAAYRTFPYVPGRHFDLITFEIKHFEGLDVTVVYVRRIIDLCRIFLSAAPSVLITTGFIQSSRPKRNNLALVPIAHPPAFLC
jgi:hypothetical protein